MVDTISGISVPGGFEANNLPEVVRYAKKITLKVKLDPSNTNNEMILPPYLEIDYEEKKTEEVLNSDSGKLADISFVSENFMDTTGFWSFASVFFWILMILMGLIAIVNLIIRAQAERLEVDAVANTASMIINSLFTTVELFANLFFWYLFAMTAWWFVFFKLQERVYCFMPALDSYAENYRSYHAMLLAVTICKFLSLAYKIVFEQSALDIFVIDWESPKMYKYKNNYPKLAINPWRRLFVINEFNELQTSKVVVSEMILILFLVLAEGFGFKNFS